MGIRTVLVVGAGIAGSTAARPLGRRWSAVTVVERSGGQRSSGSPGTSAGRPARFIPPVSSTAAENYAPCATGSSHSFWLASADPDAGRPPPRAPASTTPRSARRHPLAFGLNHLGATAEAPRLWAIVGLVVAMSVVVHGLTAKPAMQAAVVERDASRLRDDGGPRREPPVAEPLTVVVTGATGRQGSAVAAGRFGHLPHRRRSGTSGRRSRGFVVPCLRCAVRRRPIDSTDPAGPGHHEGQRRAPGHRRRTRHGAVHRASKTSWSWSGRFRDDSRRTA